MSTLFQESFNQPKFSFLKNIIAAAYYFMNPSPLHPASRPHSLFAINEKCYIFLKCV